MPKPLSAVDCISLAFAQTKNQLFAPFRRQRWMRLAMVCLLTGEFAGGGGFSGNFNVPNWHPRHPSGGGSRSSLLAAPDIPWGKILPWLPWIFVGVFLIIVFIVLYLYVASVYRFVLFDSVLYDRCELKGSWARWEPLGRSYFGWCFILFVIYAVGTAVLIGVPLAIVWKAGLFHHPGEHLAELILAGLGLFFILVLFGVLGAVIALFAKDFCVPIMAMENVGVLQAWRRLLPMLAAEKLAFAAYVLMKIVLAIGSAILVGIASILIFIALLIPLGIAGLIIFFGGKAIGLTFNPATVIILATAGAILVCGLIYVMALISTPPMVFFQSYMLHFFGSRYAPVGAVLFPPPPQAPPPPLPGTPPLFNPPPEPAPTG
jgi:hypothetical protein